MFYEAALSVSFVCWLSDFGKELLLVVFFVFIAVMTKQTGCLHSNAAPVDSSV